jgi:putative endonuclease
MYYLYILRCSDNSLYSGVSNNPERRLKEHNLGKTKASKYTRARLPVILIYFEKYGNLIQAMKREAQIKKWSKTKKEALVNENLVLLKQLSKKNT